MKYLIATVALLMAQSSFAELLKLTPSKQQIEGVAIAQFADATVGNQTVKLDLVGAGLRTKKVLIARVKVYVMQLFADNANRFARTSASALASTDDLNTVAVRLTFLRSVDANTVQASFREALQANKVNLGSAPLATFLKNVSTGGDADSGGSLTILMHKNSDGSEVVSYEDTKGHVTTVQGAKGLSHDLLSIWLGQPSDEGVAALRDQLVKGL